VASRTAASAAVSESRSDARAYACKRLQKSVHVNDYGVNETTYYNITIQYNAVKVMMPRHT